MIDLEISRKWIDKFEVDTLLIVTPSSIWQGIMRQSVTTNPRLISFLHMYVTKIATLLL